MPYKVITLNVNGLRAATRKGLTPWLVQQQADVICLQEIRIAHDQITDAMRLPGYHHFDVPAQRPGYSGVSIYTKVKPKKIHTTLGCDWADAEGRFVQADFEGLSVSSVYFPSGSHNDDRQAMKYDFLNVYRERMAKQQRQRRQHILCGDWNIAHKPIDLKNWRANQKNSGFLPEERAWMDHVLDEMGWVDAFRQVKPGPDEYTWWSNRGRAWDNNVGWRIDYQVVTPGLRDGIRSAEIYKDQRFSDHAPLMMTYEV